MKTVKKFGQLCRQSSCLWTGVTKQHIRKPVCMSSSQWKCAIVHARASAHTTWNMCEWHWQHIAMGGCEQSLPSSYLTRRFSWRLSSLTRLNKWGIKLFITLGLLVSQLAMSNNCQSVSLWYLWCLYTLAGVELQMKMICWRSSEPVCRWVAAARFSFKNSIRHGVWHTQKCKPVVWWFRSLTSKESFLEMWFMKRIFVTYLFPDENIRMNVCKHPDECLQSNLSITQTFHCKIKMVMFLHNLIAETVIGGENKKSTMLTVTNP
jgi:hypothetical protein